MRHPADTPQDLAATRFLAGNGQYMISTQRSIRNYGKRFIESEITSILVQGVGPEQEKLINSSKTSKTLEIYYWISC